MINRTHLSDAIASLHGILNRKAIAGTSFTVEEMRELAGPLAQMECEAIRLEAIEVATRTKEVADRAVETLARTAPTIDVASLEELIQGDKVVIFPVRHRPSGDRRPA